MRLTSRRTISSVGSVAAALLTGGLASTWAPSALAAPGSSDATRSIDAETFHPAMDAYGIFTVERAETGKRFEFGFKLYVDFAYQPFNLTLKDAQGATPRTSSVLMDYQLALHFGGHVALTDWLEAAVTVPISAQSYTRAYGSNGDPLAPTGFYAADPASNVGAPNAAPGDVRVALKARTPRLGPFGAALVVTGTLPFGDKTAFLGDRSFTLRPTAVVDLTFLKGFTVAANGGVILRDKTVVVDPYDVVNPPSGANGAAAQQSTLIALQHEVTFSVGAAWRALSFAGLGAELYGLIPVGLDGNPAGRTAEKPDVVLDLLGGLTFYPGRGLQIAVGAGGGLLDSHRHDNVRVFGGITWVPSEPGTGATGGLGGGDSDGDGVPDSTDQCPTEPEDKDGFQDDDGCPDPDNDRDGIPDAVDQCPGEPEDRDGFQDEDGCPDLDNDGDGIPDAQDKCPNDAEDRDGFQDDDGCPDLDNDGDGIPDAVDRCPNEAETFNGIDDDDGCPDTGGAGARGPLDLSDVKVLFDAGSAKLGDAARAELDRAAGRIRAHGAGRRLRVEGHTDDRERSGAKAEELARERADAVRSYLVKRGIAGERLQAVGYGGARPAEAGASEEARAHNRRVELIVVEQ